MAFIELGPTERNILIPVFKDCRYDRVLIDSVLEGNFGRAWVDSSQKPGLARLDSGAFTMLAGDPAAEEAKELLYLARIDYVTPQDQAWSWFLQSEFGARIIPLAFTDFTPEKLNPVHLGKLITALAEGYELRRIDYPLAERLTSDLHNAYFFENFWSIEDFLGRGIGFCVLQQGKIVCAATSMAQSSRAIDIEIETAPGFRRKGLGIVVGAQLVAWCLEQQIEPRWLAANPASEKLALKLGYTRGETYQTYEILES